MENNERSNKEVTSLGHQFECNSEKCWVRMGIITVTMMTGFTLSMTVASANTQTAATSTPASLAMPQKTQAVSSAGAINSDEKTVDTSADSNGTPVTPTPTPEATTADYVFTQNGGNYTISGYKGNATSLNLPSTYGEGSVTEIGEGAFNNKNISGTVTIPNSITKIDSNAFANNNITTLDLGTGVQSIGDDAFSLKQDDTHPDRGISKVNIPNSVISIGDRAFANNQIKQLQLGDPASNSSLDTIGADAFSGNQISSTVIIPDSVTSIGDRAFANNDITTLDLGKSVKTIGDDAFSRNTKTNSHNNISTVVIPDSVTSIGTWAFANDNIKQLQFGDSASDSNVNIEAIGAGAFSGNSISGVVLIPKSVKSIGQYGFDSSVTVVAKDAAGNHWQPVMDQNGNIAYTLLTDYDYDLNSDGTYTIKSYTGDLQKYLGTESKDGQITNLTLPSTYNGKKVTGIGDNAFNDKNITGTVTIPDTVTSIGQDAFTKNTISSVVLGSSVRTIGQDAFSVNQISGSITIPDSVTSIGVRAFAENWISGVKLGNHVQIIGNDAFARDKNLPKTSHNQISGTVVIPDSVISIGARAFANNQISQLQFVDSTSKLEAIGVDAFSGNQISGTLTIPNSVNVISMNAFANNQITALVLGQNIKEIGLYAFDSNDISKIASAKSMVSDQYLRGQHAIVLVPVNVKGNQILDVKAAIEKALRGSNTTGFELSDNLTFTDSQGKVWSYNAVTDTLADSSGQITADNLIFQLSSTGVGSYGTNELIFMVNKSDTPVTPAKPGNNTGEPNTPTQPGHQTSDVPPITTPSTPNQLVTNTTGTVTPYTPNATTVPTAPKQSHTTTFTTNRSHIRHQQGTMEKGHTASQMEEQTEETEQREMTNSLPGTTTSRHGDRQTVVTGHQTTKVMLPQTDEGSSVKPSLIGALLLSILSWFGLARRKHEND